MNKIWLVTCCLVVFSGGVSATSGDACRVMDPELAGGYVGGCKDGFAEGFGIAQGSAVYQGEFSVGKKHGRGRKTWPSGDSYEGQFVEDRREGEGIYRWGSASPWAGDFYWGGYRQDRRHGRGLYAWANGDRFEGEWKDDLRYGLSAMEIQRQRAKEAWAKSVGGVGGVVCSMQPVGVAHKLEVRGEILQLDGESVEVRVRWVQADPVLVPDGKLQPGALLKGAFYDWSPCSA